MRLPLQKILSNVRGLLVAFPSKAPRFHPVFFLPSFFFAGALTKKKRFSSEVRKKKAVPIPNFRNRDCLQSPGWILIVVIFFILERCQRMAVISFATCKVFGMVAVWPVNDFFAFFNRFLAGVTSAGEA
jgi:hypothetical protein